MGATGREWNSKTDHETEPLATMKIASRRTGLSPHLIRIWERRYRAISPARTPTNRRLFSESDLKRLRLLRLAVDAGHSIGQIANLEERALRDLLARSTERPSDDQRSPFPADREVARVQTVDLDSLISAVKRFDSKALEKGLSAAALSLTRPKLLDEVVAPLMARIGDLWAEGTLRIAHEHMATAVVRNFFASLGRAYEIPPHAPAIVIATPLGQIHEVGALIAEAAALTVGWRTVYLGANLPAEEIAAAVIANNASALGLSLVYPPDDPRVHDEIKKIARYLSGQAEIIIGGRSARFYGDLFAEIGAHRVDGIDDFCSKLNFLRDQPKSRSNN